MLATNVMIISDIISPDSLLLLLLLLRVGISRQKVEVLVGL